MSSNLQAELAAIRDGAAIFPLPVSGPNARAFLRITGPDATRWLNGMVTNSIQSLAPGEGNYNFLLNAQGRIQGDCTIYREPGDGEPTFLLETDSSQLETIHQTLDRFIIMDDVQLAQIFYVAFPIEAKTGLLLVGEQVGELLIRAVSDQWENLFGAPPAIGTMTFATANGSALVVLAPSQYSTPAYELWFPDAQEANLVREWLMPQAIEASSEAIEALRILEGRPKFGQDIRDRDLPQETAQTHALHFNKGCYLGQEIVERIRSRGQVHRTFAQFQLTGDLPSLPSPLEANGKPAGELTSAIRIGDEIVALGYIRREAMDQPLTYAGGSAAVTHPSKPHP